MREFYYNRRLLGFWFLISLIMLLGVFFIRADSYIVLLLLTMSKILALCFFIGMAYVYIIPHKLAQIDDEGIIIDHNKKLKWCDIEKAEYITSKSLCGRSFIRFKLKKNAKYPLRWMQKMSALSKYVAFSIPLYAMKKEDAKHIEKEIRKHLSVSSKLKNAVKRVFRAGAKKSHKQKKVAK